MLIEKVKIVQTENVSVIDKMILQIKLINKKLERKI